MKGEMKKRFDFGVMGIILGVIVVVLSIVWVVMMILSNDSKSCEEVTWVG